MAKPTWSSARKDMFGGTLARTRLWFTVADGILTEVFYPRVDLPQIKEMNIVVADGRGFWCDLRGVADYAVEVPAPGVPALTVRHRHQRFTVTSRICADPVRDVVLVDLALDGDDDLALYALLSPRLGKDGAHQIASRLEVGGFAGLAAEEKPWAVVMMAANADGGDALRGTHAGVIGERDTWRDFTEHGCMTWHGDDAGPGYLCLAAALPRRCTVALGFGDGTIAAATLARSSLASAFDDAWRRYCAPWRNFAESIGSETGIDAEFRPMLARSAAVIKLALDHTFPGVGVASPSTPWGETVVKTGGYHLVWARDLVETAGALLALGFEDDVRDCLRYLIATQRADGHWLQNQWTSGETH